MCALCNHYPCSSRCPNAEDTVIESCAVTGDDIYAGETYIEINGEAISKSGLNVINISDLKEITGMSIEEILIELGGEKKVGEVD